jgi:hypothetical protein
LMSDGASASAVSDGVSASAVSDGALVSDGSFETVDVVGGVAAAAVGAAESVSGVATELASGAATELASGAAAEFAPTPPSTSLKRPWRNCCTAGSCRSWLMSSSSAGSPVLAVPVPIDGATGLVVGAVGAADGARADEVSTTDAVPLVPGGTADAAPLTAATAGAGSFCRCTLQTCQ